MSCLIIKTKRNQAASKCSQQVPHGDRIVRSPRLESMRILRLRPLITHWLLSQVNQSESGVLKFFELIFHHFDSEGPARNSLTRRCRLSGAANCCDLGSTL